MAGSNSSEYETSESEEERYSSSSAEEENDNNGRNTRNRKNSRDNGTDRNVKKDKDNDNEGGRKNRKDNGSVSRKRARDDDEYEGEEETRAKRAARASSDVVFRIVVPSREIGKVIGKQGAKIKQLREETGARIKIADPVTPLEERVIIISSKAEEKEEKSAAEHALIRIVTVILEDSGGSTTTTKAGSRHVGPNMMRLLIAGSQAGSLIGMSGNTIKEIRKDSGASVQIMPQNHLPLCASASGTDRLVQISGEVSQVLKALEHIGVTLREHPPKEVISMRPSYYLAPGSANRMMLLPQSVMPGYSMQPGKFGSMYGRSGGKAAGGASNTSGDYGLPKVSMEITIPSSVVGGLIGRGGSNISEIRAASGATVKITGEKDVETRTVYFEGTAEQVEIAQTLVNSFINIQS
uniref:TSA: Wollemia nobilis Ref_Wollemi_Transcript_25054_1622 transcribed RNA sequence n=1 Tax=Wollemia nobilis TaxID=56998 RepID=A0A0C9S1P1_9CONI